MTFDGFPVAGLQFLTELGRNNTREWFKPRKEGFEEVLQAPLLALTEVINKMLEADAPGYAYPDSKKAVNRIYRDVRFSRDKTPYQTHVSVLFPHQRLGKKVGAALYFSLSATEAMIAAGLYTANTRELQAVREHLAAHHLQFRKILAAKALKEMFGELTGYGLKTTPRQFGFDHPAAELLQKKQWLLSAKMPAETVLSAEFGQRAVQGLRLLLPFVDFLNAPLLEMRVERELA